MRDTKLLEKYSEEQSKIAKEKLLFKDLKKEVETGANGTQQYVIKEGINKNKIANVKYCLITKQKIDSKLKKVQVLKEHLIHNIIQLEVRKKKIEEITCLLMLKKTWMKKLKVIS